MTVISEPPSRLWRLSSRQTPLPFSVKVLSTLVFLVTATAPIEGYARLIVPDAVKAPSSALILAYVVDLLVSRRVPRAHFAGVLTLLLLACVVASTAVNLSNSAAVTYLLRWAPFLIVTLVLMDLLATRVAVEVAILGMAVGAVIAGGGALVSFLVLGAARADGPMEDPNDLASVLTAAVPLLLLEVRAMRPLPLRRLAVPGAVLCVCGIAVTVSRGGLLALTALFVWALMWRLITLRGLMTGLVLGVVVAVVGMATAGEAVAHALQQKEYIAGTNIDTRQLRWDAALRGLAQRPLLGLGPGGAAQTYSRNSDNAEPAEQTPVTHNMYIEVAAELGVIGLASFMGIIASALVATLRAPPRLRRTSLALQGSLVAILVTSVFLSEQYYMPLWTCVAAAAALDLRIERELAR